MNEQQEDPKTILLVEDEALIAIMEKATLKKHGFNVIIAHSGENAIEIARTTPNIDLILMEINLGKGKMDGTEAAEIILKEKEIPGIFLSSYTQTGIVEKTERITTYGYVVKDSGETVLITSIKMAFKLYEVHQRLKKSEEALQKGEDRYRRITYHRGTHRLSLHSARPGRTSCGNNSQRGVHISDRIPIRRVLKFPLSLDRHGCA